MNYDIIIEKWIDQLNTLFRSIDEFCKKEQDLRPDNSSDIYYKNYCNKLIIGAYLTSPRTIHTDDQERVISDIRNYYNDYIIEKLDNIIGSIDYSRREIRKNFREYYLSSIILGIYNDKGLICKEYDAISSFIKDDFLGMSSIAYMGDMAILAPIFPISNNKNYVLLDDYYEIELFNIVQTCMLNRNTQLYKFTQTEEFIPDSIFLNMLYCNMWGNDKIKTYSISIKHFISHGLKSIYILTNLNDILENRLLKCAGISINNDYKITIINLFNDKCIVCINLLEHSTLLEYKIYEFKFSTLFIDYSHTLDIRKKLRLSKHYTIDKNDFLNRFYNNRIFDKNAKKNFRRFSLYSLISLRPDIRILPKVNYTDSTNKVSFYSIDQGKRITHKFDRDLLFSYHKTICTADDFNKISIAGSTYDNGSIRFINEPLLIINKKHYLPTYFNPVNGPIMIDISDNYLYHVNTDMVSPDYLVNELNKPSFIKKNINNAEVNQFSFLQSDIYLPNNENSLERQRQIYRYDKQIYINKLIQDFDVEISSTYNNSCSDLPKGTSLCNGKYVIESKIGEGGFSKTYKAIRLLTRDTSGIEMSSRVVIKEFFIKRLHHRKDRMVEVSIDTNVNIARKALEKFWDEANKIKELNDCSNIISIYDVFDENGTCYYSMEYVEGKDLSYYCETKPCGYLDQKEAQKIILDVCNAVKAMHKIRMNHFDIKPENILIDKYGNAKLIDFGTACQFISDNEHSTVLPVVSRGYSPIELVNITSFTPQSDIYSIAATLYNILTGYEVPSSIDLSRNFRLLKRTDNINNRIWNSIIKAMNPDLSKRPSSIEDFIKLILG